MANFAAIGQRRVQNTDDLIEVMSRADSKRCYALKSLFPLRELQELNSTMNNDMTDDVVSDSTNTTTAEDDTGATNSNVTLDLVPLEELGSEDPFNTENVQCILNFTSSESDSVENSSSTGDWQAIIILIPYIVVPAFLMVGVLLVWMNVTTPGWVQKVLDWLFLPLFILEMVLACHACTFMLLAAGANADFCSGGENQTPDGTILEVTEALAPRYEVCHTEATQFLLEVLRYYIDECRSGDPFEFIRKFEAATVAAEQAITNFLAEIEVSERAGRLASGLCGVEEVKRSAELLTKAYQDLREGITGVFDLLSCDKITPLYQLPVYDGVCTYSMSGFTWAFSSFLIASCAGFTMIMFRSSWQEDSADDSDAWGTLEHRDRPSK